jgi:hypothetical protein
MSGKELLDHVVEATALPHEPVGRELTQLIEKANYSEDGLTLEDLRQILVDYAQEVLLEAQSTYSK